MKAFSDIEQSKKLARILPSTTIDFAWNIFSDGSTRLLRIDDWEVFENAKSNVKIIPCWSLAALLEIIPYPTLYKHADETWDCASWVEKVKPYLVEGCDSPINACYGMIEKLHEQKLL